MRTLTIDLDDEDTSVALTLALEDYIAELREQERDRVDTFGRNSFTVKRVRQQRAVAERLLAEVSA